MITEEAALTAINHYVRTGEIQDVIVPYFRQTGRWVGDCRHWTKSTFRWASSIMHGAVLPEERRTEVNAQGEAVLCTSYHWRKRRNVELQWFEVKGTIRIKSLEAITATNLRSVGGDCYSCTDGKVSFPKLQSVGGDFDFQGTVRLHAPCLMEVGGSLMANECEMPNLEAVGNRFSGFWSGDLYLPKLRQVGGSLDIAGPECIIAPALVWVCYDIILAYGTTAFRANMLEEVGGSLDARYVTVFQVAALRSVGDSLHSDAAPDFYRPDFEDMVEWDMHPDAEKRWRLRGAIIALMRDMPTMDI